MTEPRRRNAVVDMPRKQASIEERMLRAREEQAKATKALAVAITEATTALSPAAEAIHQLSDAQRRLCAFLVRRRLMILGSFPIVLTTIGAVSPNAAKLLGALLRIWFPGAPS